MPDLVIRHGTVVTPEGVVRRDVAIEGGRIAAIEPELPGAAQEIDAQGLTILPGVVDTHVHFNEPGRTDWEGAATGSRALAAGGGTLFADMPLNSTPCTLNAAEFHAKRAALESTSITDFAIWGGLTPDNLDCLEKLGECGIIGFKAFMSDSGLAEFRRADDVTLYEGMRLAAQWGLPVAVHAESEEITRELSQQAAREGRRGIRDYLDSRPVLAEVEAIQRAALLAREAGCRLHIVHVSSGRGVEAALQARASGTDITIETCPHYLLFTEDDLVRLGAAAKCAPPLRDASTRDSLWQALQRGQIDFVASDHSPSSPSLKEGDDFFAIWGGIAGVQSTLPVMLSEGLGNRGLALSTVAELTATHPARRYGLARKGEIAEGCDADLCLVDLASSTTLTSEQLQQQHPYSPYLGTTFQGTIRQTIRRGEVIFRDGQILASHGGQLHAPTRTHA